jgi:hypothetical protein
MPRGIRLTVLTALATLALAAGAQADTFDVTTTADDGAGSLRDAVEDANGTEGLDLITFSATGTITLASGHIAISDAVEIQGPGAGDLTLNGDDDSRIFSINSVPKPGVTISGIHFTEGQPGDCGCGGAIQNFDGKLTVASSSFDDNHATWGGAIESFQGKLTVKQSEFTQNTASDDIGGGAIHVGDGRKTKISKTAVFQNQTNGVGGGIVLNGGKSKVDSSTVSGNESADHDGGISIDDGKVTVINSTVAGNLTAGFGGGIGNSAKLKVLSSTVAGNEAFGGGGIAGEVKSQSVTNSIVADNTAADEGQDMLGKFKTNYSLVEVKQDAKLKGKHNIFGEDPVLGPLGPNGGPTETIPLAGTNSPAYNEASKKSSPKRDQRGEDRDRKPDMGAYELVPV